jgi:hypothetical protein
MKKLFVLVFAFAVLVGGASGARADTQDFVFKTFAGDYYLSRDASGVAEMRVKEKLVAEFPDSNQNHGIERAIPETYKDHGVELRILSVTDDHGNKEQYETRSDNGYLIVRIGDEDRYVHGEKGYMIEYTMRGVSASDGEFFWDINGDQWKQKFQSVEARVHIAQGMDRQIHDRKVCYTGARGALSSDCTITYRGEADGSSTVIFTASRPLQPQETLTVGLGFTSGTFAPYTPSQWQIMQWVGIATGLTVPPLTAGIIMFMLWRRKGRDAPGKTTIVPQYTPPKGISVLGANTVFKEGFETKAISATIIDLAVRHYIKIYETAPQKTFKQATYELELIRATDALMAEERAVINLLFGSTAAIGTRIKMDDLKNELVAKAAKIGKDVDATMAREGYFTMTPAKASTPYFVTGALLLALGFLPFIFEAIALGVGILLAGIVVIIFAFAMPARTTKGVELRTYLLGVRDYIKLAEAERLKVLQSPHGSLTQKIDTGDGRQLIKLYEKLLPYAMLFGLEKDWVKQMATLYSQSPDWYSGTGTFNAVWFASSVSGFATNAQNAFSPASSSGAGAGGGGGGGGGGGW